MNRVKELVLFTLALVLIVAGTPVIDDSKLGNHIDENSQSSSEESQNRAGHGQNGNQPVLAIDKWEDGIVPYEIADDIAGTHVALIEKIMRKMEKLTAYNDRQCISFRRKVDSDSRFISIFNGPSCSAPIGSWNTYNGARKVSLHHSSFATCMAPETVLYELAHVLGYSNAQSTQETFVEINLTKFESEDTNVNHIKQQSFVKAPYHQDSAMKYDAAATSRGMSNHLIPSDILQIQSLYDCTPKQKLQRYLEVDESIRFVSDTTEEAIVSSEATDATGAETEPTAITGATETGTTTTTTVTGTTGTGTTTTTVTGTTATGTTTTGTSSTTSRATTTVPITSITTTSSQSTGITTTPSTAVTTTTNLNGASVFRSKLILPMLLPFVFWIF